MNLQQKQSQTTQRGASAGDLRCPEDELPKRVALRNRHEKQNEANESTQLATPKE
jgi:hypothetical protein